MVSQDWIWSSKISTGSQDFSAPCYDENSQVWLQGWPQSKIQSNASREHLETGACPTEVIAFLGNKNDETLRQVYSVNHLTIGSNGRKY